MAGDSRIVVGWGWLCRSGVVAIEQQAVIGPGFGRGAGGGCTHGMHGRSRI